jgi:hypothetical protein
MWHERARKLLIVLEPGVRSQEPCRRISANLDSPGAAPVPGPWFVVPGPFGVLGSWCAATEAVRHERSLKRGHELRTSTWNQMSPVRRRVGTRFEDLPPAAVEIDR